MWLICRHILRTTTYECIGNVLSVATTSVVPRVGETTASVAATVTVSVPTVSWTEIDYSICVSWAGGEDAIILVFGFILIKPKLYFRINILNKISHFTSVKPRENYCACVIRTFSPTTLSCHVPKPSYFNFRFLHNARTQVCLFVYWKYCWIIR